MEATTSLQNILPTALLTIFKIYCLSIFLFPIASVFQERRIWNPSPHLPSLSISAHFKIYIFNVVWMGITLLGGLLLLPKALLGKLLGNPFDASYEAHLVERLTGSICYYLFLAPSVKINGIENLPPLDPTTTQGKSTPPAPIYIANHASQIDLAVVYLLHRRFKWISKDSVRYLPGVGLIMTLSQHVFIQRSGNNRKSVSNLYTKSHAAIQEGLPMFFFPQGTRRMDTKLPFKDGAYKVAMENESEIVPISIEIPMGIWDTWYPLNILWGGGKKEVVLTVHERIKVKKDMDREELKKKTFDVIYSVLPQIGDGGETAGGKGGKEEVKKEK